MATCAFAIVRNNVDKILLVKIAPPFAESNKWNFPGGVMEKGESISRGLIREVIEETNIRCKILGKKDSFITPNGVDEINIYDAQYVAGDILIQQNEVSGAEWFTSQEALTLPLAFNIRDYISKLNF